MCYFRAPWASVGSQLTFWADLNFKQIKIFATLPQAFALPRPFDGQRADNVKTPRQTNKYTHTLANIFTDTNNNMTANYLGKSNVKRARSA